MKRASHLTKQCDICKLNMYGIWHDFLWKISLLWHKSFPESAKLKCKNVTFLHLKTKKGRDADGPKKNNKNLHSPFETLPLKHYQAFWPKTEELNLTEKFFQGHLHHHFLSRDKWCGPILLAPKSYAKSAASPGFSLLTKITRTPHDNF